MSNNIYKAFLDTNFFISLLNPSNALHENAKDYYEAFLINGIQLYTSTIAISEYCVKGKITELPLRNIKVMPFDLKSAVETGNIAREIFQHRSELNLARNVIPNDTKLLSHAESLSVDCFVSGDVGCNKIYKFLKNKDLVYYHFFDLTIKSSTNLGFLPNMKIQDVKITDYFKSYPVLRENNK